MTTSIFTTQTPANANASDGVPYNLGTLFKSSVNCTVISIRWYFPSGAPASTVKGRLYSYTSEATGTLLGSADFSASPTLGTWNLATFSSPIAITANTKYVAAVFTPNRYVSTSNLFGSAITNGVLTAIADSGSGHNGRFLQTGSEAYPTDTFGANGYFVDVVVNTVPDSITNSTITRELNRLNNVTDPALFLSAQGAANVYAGTTGLGLVGALNSKAGTSGLDLQGVCNALAGTSGLGPILALSLVTS